MCAIRRGVVLVCSLTWSLSMLAFVELAVRKLIVERRYIRDGQTYTRGRHRPSVVLLRLYIMAGSLV
ncbi:uncharacterized protein K452DRAFT_288941 [Aplosporella prunicola CBS 121167]|uniref:Uncharacterized protein n=1 Tax=Aplosporella prunicola CBS 121167 TaxID=1176127 RepID=A0A6A6B9Y6_9PEZI|nr:uncharacterized protein K452DRAFT_288941 [Aplosporella prunicola CBS 121167]KAF2140173.1 hypothetical protein K452DRAFT_288941 [Aplosporella prunicola CBS 121167]